MKEKEMATNVPAKIAPATFPSGCCRYSAISAVGNGRKVTSSSTKPFQYSNV